MNNPMTHDEANKITGKLQDLPRRNAAAVEQALREAETRLRDSLQTVQRLQTAVADLSGRLTAVETRLNAMVVQQFGTGPTVRA